MRLSQTFFLTLLCAAGCAGPQRGEDPAAGSRPDRSAGAALAVSLQGWVVTPNAPQGRALLPADALGEKDRLSLRVQVASAAYVYVLQTSPRGGVLSLFPASGHRQVAAQQTLRIPEDDTRTLRFDPGDSGERFIVVASPTPLSATTCTLLSLPCGPSRDRGRGGDEQNKGNTQDPDKREDRFLVDTLTAPVEQATVVTYSLTPRRR